jgi:capsular exopolysaccharide synthesis family protein
MATGMLISTVMAWLDALRGSRSATRWDLARQPGYRARPWLESDIEDLRNGARLPPVGLALPGRSRFEALLTRLDLPGRFGGRRESDARSERTRFAGLLTDAGLGRFLEVPRQSDESTIDDRLVSLLATAGFEAEQYRVLRHNIETLHRETDFRVVAVTSPGVGDGKTVTAINLAGALAQSATARVLLVDLDVRRSPVARRLGLVGSRRGLVDLLRDADLNLEDAIVEMARFNLSVLPAGRRAVAPYETLQSPRLEMLLGEIRRRFDYVVVDTAPVVPVPDTRLIAKYLDGFLVVVSAHQTPRGSLAEALNLMEPSKVIGLVFNGDDARRPTYYDVYAGAPAGGPRHRA